MPVLSTWKGPERKEYPVLPEDTYQVFIKDVETVTGKAYQSDEDVEQLKFTFMVLEGEFKNRILWKNISPVISAGGVGKSPANFNLIYEAVYKRTPYNDQLKSITAEVVNGLIDRQLVLVVKEKTSEKGNKVNKIDGFLKAKTDLPLPDGTQKPMTEKQEKHQNDYVDEDDIPVHEGGEEEEGKLDLSDIPF